MNADTTNTDTTNTDTTNMGTMNARSRNVGSIKTEKPDHPANWQRTGLQSGVLIGLCALAGVLLGSLIEHRSSMRVGALAALLGGVVAFTWHHWSRARIRRNRALIGVVVVTLFAAFAAAYVVVLWWPTTRSRSSLRSLIDATTYGWSTIVTSPVPAFAQPRTLVPVALVSCGAAAAAVSAALWGSSRLLPLLPSAIAFLLASIAAGRQQFASIAAGIMLVLLSAVIIWIRTNNPTRSHRGDPAPITPAPIAPASITSGRPPHGRWRREAAALLGVAAIATVGGLTIGPLVAFGRDKKPFDPRDHIVAPSLPENVINPLELVGARRQSKQLMFSVRSSTPLLPQDLRLVALNHFDGASWTTTAPYERAGAVLEPPVRRNVPMINMTADFTVATVDGPWLPSIGDPTAVTGIDVLTDPSSGSLVAAQKIASGSRYRVTTGRAEPDVEPLLLTPVGSSTEARDALVVAPGLPPLLESMARTAIGDVERPFERAVELRNYLRTNFAVSKSAAAGYSYGHLEVAFTKTGQATEEQFAVAFATLGRVVGLPTRVVVGFSPGQPDAEGVVNVYASDARVWAEVLFENVGWLPFVATPASEGTSSAAIGFGGGDEVELQKAPPLPATDAPTAIPTVGPAARVRRVNPGRLANVARTAVGIVGATTLIGVLIVSLKKRKTALRRRGTPRQSVLGAWHDVLDRLAESGVTRTANMTVDELIQVSEGTSAALAGLYRPVNTALYSTTEITDADQAQAWRAHDRFVQSLNRQSTRRQRFQFAIDPRPLLFSRRVIADAS